MSSQSQHTRLPIEALIEAFIAFVQAETWPDSRRILQEHPELFNQEALPILRAYVLSIKDDDDSWWYQYHYGLLQFGRLISDAEYEEEGAVDNHVVVESLFESLDPSTGPDVVVPAAFTDDYQLLAELDEAASHNPMVHGDRIVIMERMVRQAENERRSFKTALLINLGVAYAQLPSDQQASNLRKAAAYFAEAAQFFTPKTAPPAYAASQNALGISYIKLDSADHASDLEKAIACFAEALRFYSPDYAPRGYAETQVYLGSAYSMLSTGDRVTNLRKVIDCYTGALQITALEDAERENVQQRLGRVTAELNRLLGES